MSNDKNNTAPGPRPAELAKQQGVAFPPFPREYYDAFGDGSEPLYTGKQMQDYARAALAATGKQQVGEAQGDMFWLAVDGERMGYSVEELIDDMCDGEEVEIQTAAQLPNFWVRVKAGDGGSVDFDVIDQRDAATGVANA